MEGMLTHQELTLLKNTPLFHGCSMDETESLLSRCACRREVYENREILFCPESFRRELGIVLSGTIGVSRGKRLMVSELHPGDLFGAAALFNSEPAYVTTLTARSRCTVLYLTEREIQSLVDRSRLVRWNYIVYLSQRIRFLSDQVDFLTTGSGEQRVVMWLLRHLLPDGTVPAPKSMTELARHLHLGRTSLYRELNRLEDAGIISHRGKEITVLDSTALRAMVDGDSPDVENPASQS